MTGVLVKRKIYNTIWGAKKRRIMRTAAAYSRVAAKRAFVSRAYAGGAIAGGALLGYGAYKGIRRIRAARARARRKRSILKPMRRMAVKKRLQVDEGVTLKATRTLHTYNITQFGKGTAINERMYDLVNLKGWRLQMHFHNLQSNKPVMVTVCIMSSTTGEAISSDEFFRAYGTDVAKDFSINDSTLQLMNTPINTDQNTVLHRWRFIIGNQTNGAATSDSAVKSNKIFEKYIKLNRQVRMESTGTTGGAEQDPVYLVWWADIMDSPGTTAASNALNVQTRVISFFRDAQ